jgi:hypothetical protein
MDHSGSLREGSKKPLNAVRLGDKGAETWSSTHARGTPPCLKIQVVGLSV